MDKLAQYADIFGSEQAAVLWAVGVTSAVNIYGATTIGKMAVSETPPDAEPLDTIIPNPALEDMSKMEKKIEGSAIIEQAKAIIGCDWSVVVLLHSNDELEKNLAAQMLAIRLSNKYPRDYAKLVCLRIGGVNVKSSLLMHVSGRSERTERTWRGEISEILQETYEEAMKRL